jgi:hypothetical protein
MGTVKGDGLVSTQKCPACGLEVVAASEKGFKVVAPPKGYQPSEDSENRYVISFKDGVKLIFDFHDIEDVRAFAKSAFMHFDKLNDRKAKKERSKIRQELVNIREAIYSISDEAFTDLIHAENVGDFAGTHKIMLKQIDAAIRINSNAPGGTSMIKFHKAADPLLRHFELLHGSPTASVFEKAGGSGVQHSDAVEFLNNEFQLLACDELDRRQSSVTIIKAWLKSKPKTRSNTTK